jgi:hypothetical protein
MNKSVLKLYSFILLLIPIAGLGKFGYPVSSDSFSQSISLDNRLYQKSLFSSELHAERHFCMLERNIYIQPDSKYLALSVAEYWKINCPTDSIVSAPKRTNEIQIHLPEGAQKLILPDNTLGIFQEFDNNRVIFTPAFSLDAVQPLEFLLLYELPYPEDEKVTFKNTMNSNRISISLPAADILLEADGFSFNGKRSIEATAMDIYRNQFVMQADSQFTIHLIRSTPPVTPTHQKAGFLISLAGLVLILICWFGLVAKKQLMQ